MQKSKIMLVVLITVKLIICFSTDAHTLYHFPTQMNYFFNLFLLNENILKLSWFCIITYIVFTFYCNSCFYVILHCIRKKKITFYRKQMKGISKKRISTCEKKKREREMLLISQCSQLIKYFFHLSAHFRSLSNVVALLFYLSLTL